ncbi:MAG: hypothetical protein ACK4MQ_01155 [Hyphomonas sp.]
MLELEFRSRDFEFSVPCLVSLVACFGVAFWLDRYLTDEGAKAFGWFMLVIAATIAIGATCVGFLFKAQEAGRLPSQSNQVAAPTHVSGFGTAVILGVIGFLLCAAYFGHSSNGHITIPEWVGLSVVLAFSALFAWIFLFSRLFDTSTLRLAQRMMERAFAPLVPIGRWFSWADASLVFVVAPAFGVSVAGVIKRYVVLFGHLLIAIAFAWFAPAPMGIVGTLWALLGIVSVSRRWSWIETERNRVLQDPGFDRTKLRISIDEDLRDEAILGLLLLVVVLPVAMRQIHMMAPAHTVFSADGQSVNDLFAWVAFFGAELLKALPFLDWADIYNAEANTRIVPVSPLSMHVVLFSRALIDLLLISAIFQSIAISLSLSKNRHDFVTRRQGVDSLDARIEAREIASLAYRSSGEWRYRDEVSAFTHYNIRRLSRLRLKAPKGSRLNIAIDEILRLSGREVMPPAEQLVAVTAARKIDNRELDFLLEEIREAGDFDLAFLSIARRQLNRKGGIEGGRNRLVQMIVSNVPPSQEREAELREILLGPDADSLSNIRILVVQSLARNASLNPENHQVLSRALHSERAASVKSKIRSEMERYRLKPLPIEAPPLAAAS